MNNHTIFFLTILLIIFCFRCKKTDEVDTPYVQSENVHIFPNPAHAGDTISMIINEPEINWVDNDIKVFFPLTYPDTIPVKIAKIQDNRILRIIVPDTNFYQTYPVIVFSNKKQNRCDILSQIIKPEITGVWPLEGKGGTTVTVQGCDFNLFNKKIELRVNTLKAEVISQTNRQMVIKVPDGAGSGRIKLTLYNDVYKRTEIIANGPEFYYHFNNSNCTYNKVRKDYRTYSIQRDQLNRIIKESIIQSEFSNEIGDYDTMVYDQNGRLNQKISYYQGRYLNKLEKHSYDNENTIHVVESYDSNMSLTQTNEYHYSQGKLIQLNSSKWDNSTQKLQLNYSNQYNYSVNNDSSIIKRTFYNADGSEKTESSYTLVQLFDKEGNMFLSSGFSYAFYELYYNEFGFLIKQIQIDIYPPTFFIGNEYTYDCK